ncbi:MAG: hypothetical protein FWH15_06700 [Betaproteobacteria bacterium]|nr:hypothetical protein [Betaproteobacteria bacterium]
MTYPKTEIIVGVICALLPCLAFFWPAVVLWAIGAVLLIAIFSNRDRLFIALAILFGATS